MYSGFEESNVMKANLFVRGASKHEHDTSSGARLIRPRCQKFGVKCDGYRTSSTKTSTRRPLHPKLDPVFQPVFWEPSNALFKSENNYRYFQLFCNKTALQLDGVIPSDLWSRLMLQACERNESIRHGIVAIAALDLSCGVALSRRSNPRDRGLDPNSHHEFALQQYSLALRHMRNAASSGGQDIGVTLIACLVIICFETFHGNHKNASSQLGIGLRMIEEAAKKVNLRRAYIDGVSSSMLPSVDGELLQAFVRLDLQAMSFIDGNTIDTAFRKGFGLVDLTGMPTRFRTLKEARHYRELIQMQWMHFTDSLIKDGQNEFFSLQNNPLPSSAQASSSLRTEGLYYLGISQQWHDAFQPILQEVESNQANSDFLAAKTLELHALSLRFAIETVPLHGISKMKDSVSRFRKIVSLARLILDHPAAKLHQSRFTFAPHVIVPLYMVGYCCPHSGTRREAISLLLSTPRREGLWDGMMAGKIVEWLMNVEEEHIEGEYVPEEMRMVKVSLKFNMMARTANVKGLMPIKGSSELRAVEADLTW
jgi:hypothetical protein